MGNQRRNVLTAVGFSSKYVPPYDSKEKHLPGYNFCGPGTNVTRRLREGVKPVNALDNACRIHDIEIETRGPATKGRSKKALRASDKKLARAARKIALAKKTTKRERIMAWLVYRAMIANKWRQSRRS
jgi:hypothetical protein